MYKRQHLLWELGTSGHSLLLNLGASTLPGALQQRVDDAIKQYREERNPNDLIFRDRSLVNFAVDQDLVYMTTRLAGSDTAFLPFNQGSGGAGKRGGKGNPLNPQGHKTSYLWEDAWQYDNWLDLMGFFTHTEDVVDDDGRKTGERLTIFPRYHQWDAVRKLTALTAAAGVGRNALVEHSAGSGKSNTIAWLAYRLSTLHTAPSEEEMGDEIIAAGHRPDEPYFHKVVVVSDRRVLDRQLRDTIAGFDHTPGSVVKIDRDSEQLRAALEGIEARIIITTLQKFSVISEAVTRLAGSRFAIIVDEAHSSQTGEAAKDLKAVLSGLSGEEALQAAEALEARAEESAADSEDILYQEALARSAVSRGRRDNISYFAFTATPKPKTLQLFGERIVGPDGLEVCEPLHLYSMRQAIEEGFILDVLKNYTTYATYYRLANGLGSEDPEVPKGKAAATLARFVSLHPTNFSQKVEIIVEHFRAVTSHKIGGKAKAMVVTRSRLHAVRYKLAIDKYITDKGYDEIKTLVAFTGSVPDPDIPGSDFTESHMNGFAPDSLPKEFERGEYQVLVVAEKYQTGFDQPLLHTMYVDKLLSGVRAVQTLSRLNRTRLGKNDTFVLDFVNSAEDIQGHFRPFFEQTTAAPTDPNVLYNLRDRILRAAIIHPDEQAAAVKAMMSRDPSRSQSVYALTGPAVERFHEMQDAEEREDTRTAIRDFVRAYAFLGQIVPFTDTALEELYYYCRVLSPLLAGEKDDGGIDVSDAAVLTHLRIELLAECDMSLEPTDVEPLSGMRGGGRGKAAQTPLERLSEVIEHMNERFGMNLGEADAVYFEQQRVHLAGDEDVIQIARNNDFDQFAIVFERMVTESIIERRAANENLFRAFFSDAVFRRMVTEWLAAEVYATV